MLITVRLSRSEHRTSKYYGVTIIIPNVTTHPIDCELTTIVYILLYFRAISLGNIGPPVRPQDALYTKCGAHEIQDSTRIHGFTDQNMAILGTVLHLRTVLILVIPSFNPYPANVKNMVAPSNASKWRMGFNSAFKGLMYVIKYSGIRNKVSSNKRKLYTSVCLRR